MTHLVSQRNADGLPSSQSGISTLSEEQISRGVAWLRRLRQLPPDQRPARDDVERIAERLMEPVNPVWCLARIAALLLPYYEKDTPQGVREMEAEDWREALGEYPQWAIERAVRWWKSKDNPDRRRRPLEGDIAARCRIEMDGVPSAVLALGMTREIAPPDRERISPERAKAILQEVGFVPKAMP
jgi:hypothetical protein